MKELNLEQLKLKAYSTVFTAETCFNNINKGVLSLSSTSEEPLNVYANVCMRKNDTNTKLIEHSSDLTKLNSLICLVSNLGAEISSVTKNKIDDENIESKKEVNKILEKFLLEILRKGYLDQERAQTILNAVV